MTDPRAELVDDLLDALAWALLAIGAASPGEPGEDPT